MQFLNFPTLAALRWTVLAMGAYYLAARTGMALFSLQPSNITLLWLASGIGMVMCMRLGYIAFPLIVAASFAANYPGMAEAGAAAPALHTLVSASADGVAGVLAMQMMRHFVPQGLSKASDLLTFSIAVCLGPTLVSSLMISVNLVLGGYLAWDRLGGFIRMLVVADSLGILLVYPLYQSWQALAWPSAQDGRWLAGVALTIGLMLWLAVQGYPGFVYFIMPALLLLAFQVRLNGVALLLALAMIAIIAVTGRQLGPFYSASSVEANFMLVSFVYTTTFVILGIALHNQQLIASDASRQVWQNVAEHDTLTGLLSRLVFLPLQHAEHQRSARSGRPYALAMLDIDHFKEVNDIYGHQVGDAVLSQVAELIKSNLRDIDKAARIGGEEFAILFPEATAEAAAVALERLRAQLQASVLRAGEWHISVTISIGVAAYRGGDQTPDAVRETADRLLYVAKNGGRNCLRY
ncbi:MAG: sensor domain-containing diguanylate cyclase [Burkholderiales bacterium]|nr:sensor domain-containing diguanylate cyclase [Burkholderiales bacterium]